MDVINDINKSDIFARILEVGAGVPIANLIYQQSGASKTIFSSESYYSREAFSNKFGESKHRAVSAERLMDLIIDHDDVTDDILAYKYNTVLATTFQVGHYNNISTHGWIAVNYAEVIDDINSDIIKDNVKYYHISIHDSLPREEYIRIIGETGVKILNSKNDSDLSNCYIDMVLDEHLEHDVYRTLDYLRDSTTEQMLVFSDGKLKRLEDITRGIDNLIVYKGSFNPPSISHEKIMENTISRYKGNNKSVFCLSYNTYQKGKQETESFYKRIEYLNTLGYDVIVCTKPLFKDNYDFIRNKFKNNIVFPMGLDTLNRLGNDYITTNNRTNMLGDVLSHTQTFKDFNFRQDFQSCDFVCYTRDGEQINDIIKADNIIILNNENSSVSSTKIREYLSNKDWNNAKKLLPLSIQDLVIKNNVLYKMR